MLLFFVRKYNYVKFGFDSKEKEKTPSLGIVEGVYSNYLTKALISFSMLAILASASAKSEPTVAM